MSTAAAALSTKKGELIMNANFFVAVHGQALGQCLHETRSTAAPMATCRVSRAIDSFVNCETVIRRLRDDSDD